MNKLCRETVGKRANAWVVAPFLALSFLLMQTAAISAANVTVRVDISRQDMAVRVDGKEIHIWPVSTARPGYRTPTGTYKPVRLEREWYSTIYDYAPMPYSIFFYRGYAIHGTDDIANLGRPVSHGCVRLHPANARILFDLVRSNGKDATTIIVAD